SIFNVLNMIDALDEGAINRFPEGKEILDIKLFVFRQSQVHGVDVFKLPQQPLGRVFVTDKFVEILNMGGLVGFKFKWVWGSDR
ncbi:MAG TPA: DUF1629 domain-containing protein, partial [Pyrinomonadaceae bacterium]|nr:DUF1629 domain-containing protein [Pyrinomonadaceae bacterium]